MTETAGVTTDGRGSVCEPAPQGRSALARALWAGTAAAVVVAGLLLWSSQGEAVFLDMVSSAFAMCF